MFCVLLLLVFSGRWMGRLVVMATVQHHVWRGSAGKTQEMRWAATESWGSRMSGVRYR